MYCTAVRCCCYVCVYRIQMLDAIRYMIVWNPLIFLIFSVLVSKAVSEVVFFN